MVAIPWSNVKFSDLRNPQNTSSGPHTLFPLKNDMYQAQRFKKKILDFWIEGGEDTKTEICMRRTLTIMGIFEYYTSICCLFIIIIYKILQIIFPIVFLGYFCINNQGFKDL